MSVLGRYFASVLASRILAALLVLVALLQVMDLVNSVDEVLETKGRLVDVLIFAGFRLSATVEQAIPLSVLIGSAAAFITLASRSEFAVTFACGVPAARLVALCLPAPLLIVASQAILENVVSPASERAFSAWWQVASDEGVWLRGSDSIVRMERVSRDAKRLERIVIYTYDQTGRMAARLEADVAVYEDRAWLLRDVEELQIGSGGAAFERRKTAPWPGGPSPDALLDLTVAPEWMSARALAEARTAAWSPGAQPNLHETELARRFVAPLAPLVMLLLATPAMSGQRRTGEPLVGAALGIGVGLIFLITDGIFAALGRAGALPPIVSAALPAAAFGMLGVLLLSRVRD